MLYEVITNLQKTLVKQNNIELVETPDLFDNIWEDRSAIPEDVAFELDIVITSYSIHYTKLYDRRDQ